MPRTSTDDWTETELPWGPATETQPYRYRHELVRGKSTTAEHFMRAKRTLIGRIRPALQRHVWECQYCKWHSTHRGKLRRINSPEQFNQLAETWKQETAHLSNMTTRAMHPSYQRIIGMGKEAIPLILEEFRKGELDDWFWALSAITGENPITEEMAGDVDKMTEAWLQWGRATGYLRDSIQQMRPNSQT